MRGISRMFLLLLPGAFFVPFLFFRAEVPPSGGRGLFCAEVPRWAGGKGVKYRINVDFSPYTAGRDPSSGEGIEEKALREMMQIVAPFVREFRSYGTRNGLEKIVPIARELGRKVTVGAWLGRNKDENRKQVDELIRIAKTGRADRVIVGSEVFLRKDLSENELIGYIRKVKESVPAGVPVAYAENYDALLRHPRVVKEVDEVFVNYYPFWKGIPVGEAVAAIHGWHQRMKAFCKGKKVVVSETGWPSGGKVIMGAVPSLKNAAFFFKNFVSWARATGTEYFYFEAFDEAWKAKHEGPQGAHWGIWDKDGKLKYGAEVFDGKVMKDNWSGSIPGGPGKPKIEFTFVSERYDPNGYCAGRVWHVRPDRNKVAVYIRVRGGWWTKPDWRHPLTAIRAHGIWSCDITTGGVDPEADKVAAFLLKNGFQPPLMSGRSSLPAVLYQRALSYAETKR